MDFSLSTIGCSLPACLTMAGKRKLALHTGSTTGSTAGINTGINDTTTPSKPQESLTSSSHGSFERQDSDDSILTASNASEWNDDDSDDEEDNNKIVLKNHRGSSSSSSSLSSSSSSSSSFFVYLEHAASVLNLKGKQLEEEKGDDDDDNDDNDTATTMSFSSSSSSSESNLGVSFVEPLVTEVHYRPYTSKRDRYFLHYNEHDYVDFKMECLTGKGRNRKVSFQCEDVTVHELPAPEPSIRQDLFYSERELQGFLDEFVKSLNPQL
ncbi:unnamed protein product [Cylindrotheca closterium]|uniref:Uncharacterized protein n=1 Tax=Cylindrotheca closterium TaxID=2856 RepID=A0AAD2FDB1_9STRA|nr:unnamed protein product [Cylindrotheca closterium]